jgi:hypothetical protein
VALGTRVADKPNTGECPFQVTIQGDQVTSKTYAEGATVEVRQRAALTADFRSPNRNDT